MAGRGGPGAGAKIHAARAKKFKAQLDRIRDALVSAGFAVDDADPEALAETVERLAEVSKRQAAKIEDLEWEASAK